MTRAENYWLTILAIVALSCSLLRPPDNAALYAHATSNAAALAIETTTRAADSAYLRSQELLVEQAAEAEAEDLRSSISALRAMWAPVWPSIAEARTRHDALVDLLQADPVDALAVTAQLVLVSESLADMATQLAKPTSLAKVDSSTED